MPNPVAWSYSKTSDYAEHAMSYYHLAMDERNVIYLMQWQGYSDTAIARCLGYQSPFEVFHPK